jgi:hypothetical protein
VLESKGVDKITPKLNPKLFAVIAAVLFVSTMIPTAYAAKDPTVDVYGTKHLSSLPPTIDTGSIHNHIVYASYDNVKKSAVVHGINSHNPTIKKLSK